MTLVVDRPQAAERPTPEQAGPPVRRRPTGRWRRLWRGPESDPSWARPALLVLLGATALLYLVDLGASGWGNSFYSAAVLAGAKSWKAFFFGSFDPSNFITVDKPPAFLWVDDLSARLFGLNAWSILVPQALEGVAAVGLLYATVRRWFGFRAGLVAGSVLALTPVAVLMFRFNNPDALLVLLLIGAAYATTRALERGSGWWLALAAVLVGTGFVTKMLQAFLILPALGLVYLWAAPVSLRRRLLHGLGAVGALVLSAGWWPVVVSLVPAADRPYVGGSQHDNIWNLVFGYNGFGRLSGNETGSVGGGTAPGGHSVWGATGLTRLFGSDMGSQISWLLPAALVLLVAGLWLTRRAPRTDRSRAALVFWGGWLLVTGAVFSFAQGIIHPYYAVALAPAVAALVAIGATLLWRRRSSLSAKVVLAVAVLVTSVWSFVLLQRTPQWLPWLQALVIVGGLFASALLVASHWFATRAAAAVGALAGAVCLLGPTAYALDTAATPHSGAIPTAGPTVLGSGPGGGAAPTGLTPPGGGHGAGGVPRFFRGGTGRRPFPSFGAGGAPGGRLGRGGGAGGLLQGSTPSRQTVRLLQRHASRFTWVAATVGANSAAGYQLSTGDAVMAIGGFNGTDPAPTLRQFQTDVAHGEIHYFIAAGGGGGGFAGFGGALGGARAGLSHTSDSSAITTWVEGHFRSVTVGGVTLYDLGAPR